MITSRLTSKGQTTIPVTVREALGLRPHDRLAYELGDGEVMIQPVRGTIFDHGSTVRPKKRPENFRSARKSVKRKIAHRGAGE